jgi:hypothetical protein
MTKFNCIETKKNLLLLYTTQVQMLLQCSNWEAERKKCAHYRYLTKLFLRTGHVIFRFSTIVDFFVPRLFEEKRRIYVVVCLSHFRVQSITLSFIKEIWNNLAQMFVIIGRWVMRNNQSPYFQGQGSTCSFKVNIVYLKVYVVSGP